MSKAVPLRVVLVFAGDNLEERHFDASETITVGSSRQATFLVPDRGRGEAFALLRPGPDGLYRVTLDRQMTGKLYVGGRPYVVEEIAMNDGEAPPIGPGDWGIIGLDKAGQVALFFQPITDTAPILPPKMNLMDRFLGEGLAISAVVQLSVLIIAFWNWAPTDELEVDPPPSNAIAKILNEAKEEQKEKNKGGGEKKLKEPDQSKRAEGKEGKVGHKDAKVAETKIPKGERDQIASKVSQMGLLGMMKKSRSNGALASLLSDTPDATMTTAMAGLKGTQLQVGKGSGGMSTRGEGGGGGGTGKGQLFGVGNLGVGGGGTGKGPGGGSGPGSGGGHAAKELKVSVSTGPPSTDGGLTKEQILKVVQAHASAIQFCYEKELQRFPNLAGKVMLNWKVDTEGHVTTSKVDSSTLSNPAAEGCMSRQVKAWIFPKSTGPTTVNFPFFFKGA